LKKKSYYPRTNAKLEVDANLLGPCGFYCGYCLAFKEETCLGCRYQAEKKETSGVVDVFCHLLACSDAKGLKRCADCPEHPCKNYEPERSIFSKLYIDYLRNDARKK